MTKTRVSFCLPFELVDEGEYSVSLDGRIATIKVSAIPRSKEDFEKVTGMKYEASGSGSVRITPDTRGVSIISQIHVEVPYYVDIENCVSEVLRYLNRLVEVWRFATKKFWIPYVSDEDIFTVNWEAVNNSGKGRKGFMFGSTRPSTYPLKILEANQVMDIMRELLSSERKIPIYEILRLNAINHFISGEHNLAVIEMNTALEVLVAVFLATKLREQKLSKEEIYNRLDKYLSGISLHRLLDRILRQVDGRSLKDNPDLWKRFETARVIRKNVIHPWVKILKREDAEKVLLSIEQIMRWIIQKD